MPNMLKPTSQELVDNAIDITQPRGVEVMIRGDGSMVWVNVDGVCVLRVCKITHLTVDDQRTELTIGRVE